MAVGIRIRGSAGQMQISDEAPCYMHVLSGTFNRQTNPAGGAMNNGEMMAVQQVMFSQPVTSQQIPLVFIRFLSPTFIYKFGVIGSPGNWTGFRIMSWPQDSNADFGTACDYFVASATVPKSNTPIGIRIRNKNTGEIIFDSGYKLVRFQSYATTLSYGYAEAWGRNMYYVSKPPGSYMLVNQYTGETCEGGVCWLAYTQYYPNNIYFWVGNNWGGEVNHSLFIWSVVFATIGT